MLLAVFVEEFKVLGRLVVVQSFVDLLVERRSLEIVLDDLIPDGLNAHAQLLTFVVSDGEIQTHEHDDETEQSEQRDGDEHGLVQKSDLVERVVHFEILNVLKENVAFLDHHHWTTVGVQVCVVVLVGLPFDVVRWRVEFNVAGVFRQDDFDRHLFEQLIVVDVIDQTHLQHVLVALVEQVLVRWDVVAEHVVRLPAAVQWKARANLDFHLILHFSHVARGDVADLIAIVDVASGRGQRCLEGLHSRETVLLALEVQA